VSVLEVLRAPFPYFGGKSRVAAAVWDRFGDCANYVEPFAGSLAVLLARPHAPKIETVNDKDCFLANFWRATQAAPEQVARWADWPVNEADLHARHLWLVNEGAEHVERLKSEPDYYDAKIAGWWVWGICQWIGHGWCARPDWKARPALGNAGVGVHKKRPHLMTGGRGVHRVGGPPRQMPSVGDGGRGVHQLEGDTSALLCAISERLRRVRVCCGDWSRVVTPSVTVKNGTTAVFLDPPYSHDVRDGRLYGVKEDIAADVRAWAIENGANPELRIALCGYEGEHAMPQEWSVFRWETAGGYGSQGDGRARQNAGLETIWFSPHCLGPHSAQLTLPMEAA
jgi:hypothetical protein